MRGRGESLNVCACVSYSGFGDRLLSEMKSLTPKDVKIRVSETGLDVLVSGAELVGVVCSSSLLTSSLDICSSRSFVLNVDGVSPCIMHEYMCIYILHTCTAGQSWLHWTPSRRCGFQRRNTMKVVLE